MKNEKVIKFVTALKEAMKANDIYSIVLRPGVSNETGAVQLEICIDGYDETLEALHHEDDVWSAFDTLTSFLTIDLKNPTTCNIYEHTIDRVLEKLEAGEHFLHDSDLDVDNSEGVRQHQIKQLKSLVGKHVTGEVVSVRAFGAVIRIKPGIFGRLHVSEWRDAKLVKGDIITAEAYDLDLYEPCLMLKNMIR